ncbi:MAG: FlxA-like family protein [Desulfovibrio sp.]
MPRSGPGGPSDDADTADSTLKQLKERIEDLEKQLKELAADSMPEEETQARQGLLETRPAQLKLEYVKAKNKTGDAGSGGGDGVFDAAVQAVSPRAG